MQNSPKPGSGVQGSTAARLIRARAYTALALASLVAAPLSAQRPTAIVLKPPTATHPEEFTFVFGLRELSDGRVIVSDNRESKLLVLDFATGSSAAIGRSGRGPNEYSMLTYVYPLGADSSIMADVMQRRWLLFDGPRIVATVPADDPAVRATEGFVFGADLRGHVLRPAMKRAPDGVSTTASHDSTMVILIDRATGRSDTVARLRAAPRRSEVRRDGTGKITFSSSMVSGVLQHEEQAWLFNDGWLAVARTDPFRVDWRSPLGAWLRSTPLPVQQVRVDARERAAYLERNKANFGPSAQVPGMPPREPPTASEFPEFIPVFPMGLSLMQGPAGTLLVRRSKSADFTGSHYFVIDRRGRLLGEISLPASETIVGSGPNTVYVAVKDEDDVLRLRRHPWP